MCEDDTGADDSIAGSDCLDNQTRACYPICLQSLAGRSERGDDAATGFCITFAAVAPIAEHPQARHYDAHTLDAAIGLRCSDPPTSIAERSRSSFCERSQKQFVKPSGVMHTETSSHVGP